VLCDLAIVCVLLVRRGISVRKKLKEWEEEPTQKDNCQPVLRGP